MSKEREKIVFITIGEGKLNRADWPIATLPYLKQTNKKKKKKTNKQTKKAEVAEHQLGLNKSFGGKL